MDLSKKKKKKKKNSSFLLLLPKNNPPIDGPYVVMESLNLVTNNFGLSSVNLSFNFH